MRIVVTGAAGFVGGHVAHALLSQGHLVVGVDRAPSSVDAQQRHLLRWTSLTEHPAFRAVPHDLLDVDLRATLDGADAVLHFAGRPGMSPSWQEYPAYLRDNVEVTGALAAACCEVGTPVVVHASSSSVYGRLAVGDELTPREPVSPYGVSKLAAEATMFAYQAAHGLPAVVLRLFSVYGPGQRPDMGIHRAVEAALTGRPFTLHSGSQTRSLTYVGDVVTAVQLALDHAVEHGGTGRAYNIGGPGPVSMQDVLAEIGRLTGTPVRTTATADPPGNQEHTDGDTSRAALELGYVPKIGLAEGLSRQIAWQAARPRTAGTA